MSDSRAAAEQIIDRIQYLRWTLLPPYTYNEDEDEKTVEEYLIFYSTNINKCIESVTLYIEALREFYRDTHSETTFQEIMHIRETYIGNFPFCYDELEDEKDEEKPNFIEYMRSVYTKGASNLFLLRTCLEYRDLLQELKQKTRFPLTNN